MRYAIMMGFVLLVPGILAVPQGTAQRKVPCKTPEIAPMCYWTRGRLALYNGNPGWRIWKIGTKRILDVYSGPDSERIDPLDNEHPEFPANLDRAYEAEYQRKIKAKEPDAEWPDTVFADFEVCPLEPEHPGWMQSVCIESAKNIFLQRDSYIPRY